MSNTQIPLPGEKGYWTYLYNQMLSALGDGSFMRFNGYTVPGRNFQYRNVDEFLKLMEYVKEQSNIENKRSSYIGRRVAGQR